MMTKNNTFKKTLMATAVASGMLFAGAAQAQQIITFDPGTPDGVDRTALLGGNAFDGSAVQTDRLNMIAVNDSLAESGIAAGDTENSTWRLSVAADGSFTESFTFVVTSATLNNATQAVYGSPNLGAPGSALDPDDTYVTVRASLSGQLNNSVASVLAAGSTTGVADLLNVTYDAGGTFSFFFFDDFDADPAVAGDPIGVFEVVNGQSNVGLSDARVEFGWDTVAQSGVDPFFRDASGNPFNPITELLQDFTQTVEVFSVTDNLNGTIDINVFSRGAALGFSEFPNVPEPGALALFGVGLLGLGVVSYRRRKQVIAA